MSGQQQTDLDEVKRRLAEQAEEYAEHLFGQPNRETRNRHEWRWGEKGGISLVVRGPKRGLYCNHGSGSEGGSLIDATMFVRKCSVGEAIHYAKHKLGIDKNYKPQPISDAVLRERERKRAQDEAEALAAEAASRDLARRLTAQSVPVPGTPSGHYLVNVRKAAIAASGLPECVRHHPGRNALLLSATLPTGRVERVQLVYLTPQGEKLGTDELERLGLPRNAKQTFGRKTKAVVRLPGPANEPLVVAEGPETGLTAWSACGLETWIALGPIPGIDLPAGRPIIVCRDDDPKFSPPDKKLNSSIAEWRRQGLDVVIATPWPTRRYDGTDMNNTAQEQGLEAVRARILAARTPTENPPSSRLSVEDARTTLDLEMEWFFSDVLLFDQDADKAEGRDPRVDAIKSDLGTGKSYIARRNAAVTLAKMRVAGDKRNIVIAVPTHKLGDEQAAAFNALPEARAANLTSAVWRGREAADPNAPGNAMCLHLEAIRDAHAAGLPVQPSVCRKKAEDGSFIECPFFHECGYQHQSRQKADLWFVAHELLYTMKPAAIGELAALVVDESCWQAGLKGVDGKKITLSLDSFDPAGITEPHLEVHQSFVGLRFRVLDALRSWPDGPIQRSRMLGVMAARDAKEARALEFQSLVDPGMHPRMTAEQRREARNQAAGNRTVLRLADFWHAMEHMLSDDGPEASGWAALATVEGEDGPVKVLHLKGRKPIRSGWQVPTLHLDATMNVDLLRPFWPQIKLRAEIRVAAPHMHVRQVTDRAFSKAMLEQNPEAEDAKRRSKNLRNLHAILCRETRWHADEGRTLIVSQLAIEEALPSIGPLPPQADVAHHNAVAGRDEWRDTRNLVLVGRTLPGPIAVERMAEALTGAAVKSVGVGKWFVRADATREIVEGEWPNQTTRFVPAEADRHTDAITEAIRWQVCEGQLVQIIGRARGVNRTAAAPVNVLVLTDVPLPLPLTATLSAQEVEPNLEDLMLAAGGIAYRNPADMAAAYPHLWPTTGAAAQAVKRESLGTLPYNKCTYRRAYLSSGLKPLSYQLVGAGKRPYAARYDPSVVLDPESAVVTHLGPLAWCRVDVPPTEPPEPPEPPRRPTREEADERIEELMGSAASFFPAAGSDRDWRPVSLFDEIPIEPDDAWHPWRACPWSEDGPEFDWPLRMGALPGGYGAGLAYLGAPPTGPP